MKKLYSILALLLIAFTFGGCTLSMEEWLEDPATSEVPEEKRGVDAPYTETIPDVITVTYKYNPGVRPVTTKHRGYLAYIEADTIIYFYDNMPKDLLPLEGEYLAAGSAPQFPDGLNHRVLTVERAGGLYKVVMTKATVDEVYDDLVYELDVAYNPPMNDYMEVEDTTQVDYSNSNGNGEPKTIEDWTLYEKVKGITDEEVQCIKRANTRSITGAKTRVLTRAEKKDTTEKTDEESFGFNYKLDTSSSGAADHNAWYKSVLNEIINVYTAQKKADLGPDKIKSFYFELNYAYTSIVRGYSKVNKEEKYELTYTETKNKHKVSAALGFDLGVKYTVADDRSNFAAGNAKQNSLDNAIWGLLEGPAPDVQKKKLKDLEFKLVIPCAVPVAFVFKYGFDIQLFFNANLGLFYETESVTIQGFEYKNKKKTPYNPPAPKESSSWGLVGGGSFNFALGAKASVGVQFGGTLGVDFGLNGDCKLIEIKKSLDTDMTAGTSFYVTPFITFYVSPFGFDLWDQQITFDKSWKLWDEQYTYNPKLTVSEVPGTLKSDVLLGTSLNYGYHISKMGLGLENDKLLPRLAIYKNSIKDANLIAHIPPSTDPADEPIKGREYYLFRYEFDDKNPYESKNKYIAVPALRNPKDSSYIYYNKNAYTYKAIEPYLKIVGIAQESATDAYGDYNFSDDVDLVEYKLAVELEGGATELAKDYGIMVSIPKLGIVAHMISLKRYTIYSSSTRVVSVSFFSDYVARDWNMEVEVSTYVIDDNDIFTYGEDELLEIGYPMEYKKYTSERSLNYRVDVNIE
jgi:hypothetical protein